MHPVGVPYIFTSFSNNSSFQSFCSGFEYHTFLHHSQTCPDNPDKRLLFEYHTFLHHSQTYEKQFRYDGKFEYHTFLHHSQTGHGNGTLCIRLSTIHFYIILKHILRTYTLLLRLSTIHFYIILKRLLKNWM